MSTLATAPVIVMLRSRSRSRSRWRGALAAMAAASGLVMPSVVSAQTAPAGAEPVLVAEHLRNPRQLVIGHDGSLYVAEAGTGQLNASDQTIPCATGPEGTACVGDTSALTRVRRPASTHPTATRVLDGLLSSARPDGSAATGLDAISFDDDGRLYGIVTHTDATVPATVEASNGKLIRIRHGRFTSIADIGSYSLARPMPGHEPDSNPYGVLATEDGIYVVDAGNNTLLRVEHGDITQLATFEFRPHDPIDGVPTSIALRRGKLYVGQLSSLAPGKAKVTVFDLDGQRLRTIDDLTSVNSIAVARNGDVYVTEIFTGRPFASSGALVKIPADGTARVTTTLDTPGGVALDGRGHLYVSIKSTSSDGSVMRLPA